MPKLTSMKIPGSNFTFQAVGIDDLGATEYTLATIAVDTTGSVFYFADELRDMLIAAVEACQKSPRANNLMIRVLEYNDSIGVREIHGFKLLADIDASAYPKFKPAGLTPLFDAAFNAIGAMVDYGRQLGDQDFLANGITFIITDGCDNASSMTTAMIRRQIEEVRRDESLESIINVLIGVNDNDPYVHDLLDKFQREAGLDQYTPAGEATPGRLAKLADFVSQSVTSQSQALGTGGPSQSISATI